MAKNHRSLAGYSPWGHKELDMTEWLTFSPIFFSLGVGFLNFWSYWKGLTISEIKKKFPIVSLDTFTVLFFNIYISNPWIYWYKVWSVDSTIFYSRWYPVFSTYCTLHFYSLYLIYLIFGKTMFSQITR